MRGGGGVAPVVEQNLSLSIINTVSSSPPYLTVIFSRMKSYVATSFALNAGELSANRTSASRSGVHCVTTVVTPFPNPNKPFLVHCKSFPTQPHPKVTHSRHDSAGQTPPPPAETGSKRSARTRSRTSRAETRRAIIGTDSRRRRAIGTDSSLNG
jgi:hypothetical protein